jgi:alpha-amylase
VKLAAGAYRASGATARVTWKSSKPRVAKVSATGTIRALKAGSATIRATAPGGMRAAIKVTVGARGGVAVTKVTAKGVPSTMTVGQIAYATPKYSPASAKAVRVTYASSSRRVLAVDKVGRLVAKAPGKATLTVKAGKATARFRVTVRSADDAG